MMQYDRTVTRNQSELKIETPTVAKLNTNNLFNLYTYINTHKQANAGERKVENVIVGTHAYK